MEEVQKMQLETVDGQPQEKQIMEHILYILVITKYIKFMRIK